MTLNDFLKVTDKNTFLTVSISVCGMEFETRHTAEFFTENGDELNSRKIVKVYNSDGDIHIRLVN